MLNFSISDKMQSKPEYRNLLQRPPTKKYVIVSDVETKGICCFIRRTWADLESGIFFYPPPTIMRTKGRRTLKEEELPNQTDWYQYTLDYIYDEAGNFGANPT